MWLGVPEPTKWCIAQKTAHALCHPLGQQRICPRNENKKISVKKICKVLEIHGRIILPTNDYLLFESFLLHIIA